MNRKAHLNRTIIRHIVSHGFTCLEQAGVIYMILPFISPKGYRGNQIMRINNLAHAYKVMGY